MVVIDSIIANQTDRSEEEKAKKMKVFIRCNLPFHFLDY